MAPSSDSRAVRGTSTPLKKITWDGTESLRTAMSNASDVAPGWKCVLLNVHGTAASAEAPGAALNVTTAEVAVRPNRFLFMLSEQVDTGADELFCSCTWKTVLPPCRTNRPLNARPKSDPSSFGAPAELEEAVAAGAAGGTAGGAGAGVPNRSPSPPAGAAGGAALVGAAGAAVSPKPRPKRSSTGAAGPPPAPAPAPVPGVGVFVSSSPSEEYMLEPSERSSSSSARTFLVMISSGDLW